MSGKAGPSDGAPLDGDRAAHGNAFAEGAGTAISWLTVVPMRGAKVFDRITGRRAMAAAPIAGFVPGLAAVLVAVIVSGGAWLFARVGGIGSGLAGDPGTPPVAAATSPLLAALMGVLIVCVAELVTRAMHIDGLADVADALGSYRDPEGAREILRSPDTGPMGAGAVALTLVAQAAAMAVLAHGFAVAVFQAPWILDAESDVVRVVASTLMLALPFVIGRAAATTACHRSLPPMAPTGFGALVGATQSTWTLVAWWVPLTAAGAIVAGVAGVLACLAVMVFAVVFGRLAVRRLGGVNGDVLGAIIQMATLIAAIFLALG